MCLGGYGVVVLWRREVTVTQTDGWEGRIVKEEEGRVGRREGEGGRGRCKRKERTVGSHCYTEVDRGREDTLA